MEYQDYLRSPQWAAIRRAVWQRCGGVCEHCGQEPMQQVHHKTYARLFKEHLTDLEGLCEMCHEFRHGLWADPTRPPSIADLERLLREV